MIQVKFSYCSSFHVLIVIFFHILDPLETNYYFFNNIFISNEASEEGGAIKWSSSKPFIDISNIFVENTAQYGDDLASFPIKLRLIVYTDKTMSSLVFDSNSLNESLILNNVSSGNPIQYVLLVQMVDVYENIVTINEGYIF